MTLLDAGRLDEARSEAARLAGDSPNDEGRLLLAVEVYERLGERETRDSLLDRAVALAKRTSAPDALLRLGDVLLRADRPGPAADVYALVVMPDVDDRPTRRYIEALYRAGRFEDALSACSALTAGTGLSRFCTETSSVIHEQLGNLAEARRLCEAYVKERGPEPGIVVRLGLILLRSGDTSGLRDLLDVLDLQAASADVQLATVLSHLLEEAGRPAEALDVLFEMRRRNLGKAPAHLTFIGRFMTLSRDLERPTKVAADVAVKLTGVGAPGWILISSASDAAIEVGEYPLSHPTSQAVIEKQVGAPVTFAKSPEKQWAVAEVDSRHAFAYRQSLELFPARFPEDPSLEQHAAPEDMREFVETIRQRLLAGEPRYQAMLEAYGEGRLTVGALAEISKRSPTEAIGMVAASEHGLVACANSHAEKEAAVRLFRRSETQFVADFTALFVLHELGLLEKATRARKLVVARSTLDALRQELLRWRAMPREGHMTLGIENDRVVRREVSPADIDRRRLSLEAMISLIDGTCTVAGVAPAVAQRHAGHREFGPLIGESFWHTLLLCTAPSRVLLTDDLWLQRLGTATVKVEGLCTAHLLLAMAMEGALDRATYTEALVKLIASGYRHVATDGKVLEGAARLDGWRPQALFLKCVQTLQGPGADLTSAVVVAVEFLRLLWFDIVLPDQRTALTIPIMDALVTGRRYGDVVRLVRQHIARAFALIPVGEAEMQSLVSAWERARPVR
ncbi:MAG: hypothetical protein JST00_14135 [Deltaproteobacteria bacterium]|nr:hypothetical protein [Deltaproteobacteria bacterium]